MASKIRNSIIGTVLGLSMLISCQGLNSLSNCSADNTTVELYNVSSTRELVVEFPKTPNVKLPNMICGWKVTAPAGFVILVSGKYNSPASCTTLFTKAYSGEKAFSSKALGGKFCGVVTQDLLSDDNTVYVETKTDGSAQDIRASFTFKAIRRELPECKNGESIVYNVTATAGVTGNITSPYYDLSINKITGLLYLAGCGWRIKAPPGHVIKLNVVVSSPMECRELQVYEGKDKISANKVTEFKYCSTLLRSPDTTVWSTGEDLLVHFFGVSFTIKRFYLEYTVVLRPATECLAGRPEENLGITIQDLQGTIASPRQPSSNLKCRWRFLGPPNHVLKLYVDYIDLKKRDCSSFSISNRLVLFNGVYLDSHILHMASCYSSSRSPHRPSFYVYSDNKVSELVYFSTRSDGTSPSFVANYTFVPFESSTAGNCTENEECLTTLEGPGSTVVTPNDNTDTYLPNNMKHAWNITVDPSYRIQITDIGFYARRGTSCNEEYFELRDGPSASSPVMFKMCTNNNGKFPMYTTSNHLYVTLKTAASGSRKYKFDWYYHQVKVVPASHACAGEGEMIVLKSETGTFASMQYPRYYPNYADCLWVIKAPLARIVRLRFNKLDLENSVNCTADYIQVQNGPYEGDPVIARLCGKSQEPREVATTTAMSRVVFMSNREGRYPGFEAEFYSVEDPAFGNCTVQGKDNQIHLSGESGVIFSPNYPTFFPRNMMCTWLITAPKGKKIKLKFTHLSLSSACKANVEIRDGDDAQSELLGKVCGYKMPENFYSSGEMLWVRFTSDRDSSSGRNFRATYELANYQPLKVACRRSNSDLNEYKLTGSPTGAIASYDYPAKYDNDVTCVWQIEVENWRRIKLNFESFNLEKSGGCKADYVEIRDGYSFKELLGRYCGDSKPEPVYSSGELMWIKFKTNGSGKYEGFKASYDTELSVAALIFIGVGVGLGVLLLLSFVIYYNRYTILQCCRKPNPAACVPEASGSNMVLTSKF